MKTRENQRACDDCFHREACHMWSSGAISKTVASKCPQFEPVSYETIKELQDLYKMHKGEVAPVRHGKWMWESPFKACSICGTYIHATNTLGARFWKYCPNCGSKMDGGKNNG